tara:strand:- start:146 stop:355 length:210 start_codon:yes stop_codon:yes gene_type:complete
MKGKEDKTSGAKSKKSTKKSTRKRIKKSNNELDDPGIILIEDDLEIDKEKELEERRAYLEEARSQDASE